MMLANNTAFLMADVALLKLKWYIHQDKRRMDYYRDEMDMLVDKIASILDFYPILNSHELWFDVENKLQLEKFINPTIGILIVKMPINPKHSDTLVIDYSKNKSYVRKNK